MSISATEGVRTGFYQPPTQGAGGSEDKQMFLELLVAQLRYQDPMNPTDSSEFLAQSAQFTALEKMQAVADQTAALLASQISFGAAGLVGRYVTYLKEDGTAVSGLVESVQFDETGPALSVGGNLISLGQVQTIATAPPTTTDPTDEPVTP